MREALENEMLVPYCKYVQYEEKRTRLRWNAGASRTEPLVCFDNGAMNTTCTVAIQ